MVQECTPKAQCTHVHVHVSEKGYWMNVHVYLNIVPACLWNSLSSMFLFFVPVDLMQQAWPPRGDAPLRWAHIPLPMAAWLPRTAVWPLYQAEQEHPCMDLKHQCREMVKITLINMYLSLVILFCLLFQVAAPPVMGTWHLLMTLLVPLFMEAVHGTPV